MTTEQILKIAETLLNPEVEQPHQEICKKVYEKLVYQMTDERTIKNGMDVVEPERRFDSFVGLFDARVEEETARIANWLYTNMQNLFMLEKKGIIKITC